MHIYNVCTLFRLITGSKIFYGFVKHLICIFIYLFIDVYTLYLFAYSFIVKNKQQKNLGIVQRAHLHIIHY